MQCPQCGQAIPTGTTCPNCALSQANAARTILNAGLKGGTIGLVIGLVMLTVLLDQALANGLVGPALLIPAITFTAGLLLGRHQAKREQK